MHDYLLNFHVSSLDYNSVVEGCLKKDMCHNAFDSWYDAIQYNKEMHKAQQNKGRWPEFFLWWMALTNPISPWSSGPALGYLHGMSLQWRHNECDGVSNHQPHNCLLNGLFRSRSKKTSKLRVTGLCAGNSPVTGEFPAQRASNAENVSISWRHHVVRGLISSFAAIATHFEIGHP